MDESTLLRNATVQEIQLELIRRTCFNAMDGRIVFDGLLRHRDLWRAAILDRPGLPDPDRPDHLARMSLIKLRDLSRNVWNADTLFLLTPSPEHARTLKSIAETEDWGAEVSTIDDREEIEGPLGCFPSTSGLLILWWD